MPKAYGHAGLLCSREALLLTYLAPVLPVPAFATLFWLPELVLELEVPTAWDALVSLEGTALLSAAWAAAVAAMVGLGLAAVTAACKHSQQVSPIGGSLAYLHLSTPS